MAKVFLDAGHGGRDPGAGGNGIQEKNITLPVTLKIGDILKNHDINVGYSRTTDIFVELEDRASLANNFGANVFVTAMLLRILRLREWKLTAILEVLQGENYRKMYTTV